MEDLIIIGTGPAGLYSSTIASLHGLKGIVLEGLDSVGGQLTALYPEKDIVDIPGFTKITAKGFIDELVKQNDSRENKFPIHLSETLVSYEKKDGYYTLKTNKGEYDTKCVLLSTGMGVFSPRKIGVEGEDSYKNIYYSVTNKELFRGKKTVILGGGDSAVDFACMLSNVASKVSIVHRRDQFRAKDEQVKEMESLGVEIVKPFNVDSLKGENGTATSIVLKNALGETKEIDFDLLIVNYGLQTVNMNFEIEMLGGGYKTDTYQMTSEENIFAIGNSCFYPGKVKNITSALGESVTAITKIDQIVHPDKNIPIHF